MTQKLAEIIFLLYILLVTLDNDTDRHQDISHIFLIVLFKNIKILL